jgi:hypothetical protein
VGVGLYRRREREMRGEEERREVKMNENDDKTDKML